jgi:hypothetical protein
MDLVFAVLLVGCCTAVALQTHTAPAAAAAEAAAGKRTAAAAGLGSLVAVSHTCPFLVEMLLLLLA